MVPVPVNVVVVFKGVSITIIVELVELPSVPVVTKSDVTDSRSVSVWQLVTARRFLIYNNGLVGLPLVL